jgi:hypothetical protein
MFLNFFVADAIRLLQTIEPGDYNRAASGTKAETLRARLPEVTNSRSSAPPCIDESHARIRQPLMKMTRAIKGTPASCRPCRAPALPPDQQITIAGK